MKSIMLFPLILFLIGVNPVVAQEEKKEIPQWQMNLGIGAAAVLLIGAAVHEWWWKPHKKAVYEKAAAEKFQQEEREKKLRSDAKQAGTHEKVREIQSLRSLEKEERNKRFEILRTQVDSLLEIKRLEDLAKTRQKDSLQARTNQKRDSIKTRLESLQFNNRYIS